MSDKTVLLPAARLRSSGGNWPMFTHVRMAVHSKFYRSQFLAIALGVLLGIALSIFVNPFVEHICNNSLSSYGIVPVLQVADSDSPVEAAPAMTEESSSTPKTLLVDQPLPQLRYVTPPDYAGDIAATGGKTKSPLPRPHFFSHELGIRSKLVWIILAVSVDEIPTVQMVLERNFNSPANRFSAGDIDISALVTGPAALLRHIRMSNLLANVSTFEVPDLPLASDGDDSLADSAALAAILRRIGVELRSRYDWFLITKPTVYVRYGLLYKSLLKMKPTFSHFLMAGDSSDACTGSFKALLLSNALMDEVYQGLESPPCRAQQPLQLECIESLLEERCSPRLSLSDSAKFQIAPYPTTPENVKQIAVSTCLAVHPVDSVEAYDRLNSIFLEGDINRTTAELEAVRRELIRLVVKLPPLENEPSWPVDVHPPLKPRNRFDMTYWQFLNTTHIFFTDEFTIVQRLAGPDLDDINDVVQAAMEYIKRESPEGLEPIGLESGYRKFDPARGMEYLLYISCNDSRLGKTGLKLVQSLKPLNLLEPIEAPHVTEDSVVTIVVSVFNEVAGVTFVEQMLTLLKTDDRIRVWLLLVYSNKDDGGENELNDKYSLLKNRVAKAESQYSGKVAWLSVRTPHTAPLHLFEAFVRTRGAQATFDPKKASNGKRQDGQVKDGDDTDNNEDWLILLLPAESLFGRDFINRVRLMTIRQYQVYVPIAFSQYHPDLIAEPLSLRAINGAIVQSSSSRAAETTTSTSSSTTTSATASDPFALLELTAKHGHFDPLDFDTISFYMADYSTCRRQVNQQASPSDLADIFLACTSLHVFRAADPGLKRHYRVPTPSMTSSCNDYTVPIEVDACWSRLETGLGNRKHMAAKLVEHLQEKQATTTTTTTSKSNKVKKPKKSQ